MPLKAATPGLGPGFTGPVDKDIGDVGVFKKRLQGREIALQIGERRLA